jgi:predicted DNA-binding transcriptional regulator YafY
MGKKYFTEEQIAFALRQAEAGTSVAEIIRKLGISEQTFYRWKKRFAGLGIAVACLGNPEPVGMKVYCPTGKETFDDETTEEAPPR